MQQVEALPISGTFLSHGLLCSKIINRVNSWSVIMMMGNGVLRKWVITYLMLALDKRSWWWVMEFLINRWSPTWSLDSWSSIMMMGNGVFSSRCSTSWSLDSWSIIMVMVNGVFGKQRITFWSLDSCYVIVMMDHEKWITSYLIPGLLSSYMIMYIGALGSRWSHTWSLDSWSAIMMMGIGVLSSRWSPT